MFLDCKYPYGGSDVFEVVDPYSRYFSCMSGILKIDECCYVYNVSHATATQSIIF